MMGSLVRLEEHFQNIEAERLRKAIDDYVAVKAKQGIDESYFGNETTKGLRLLDVLTRRFDVVFTNPPYMSNRNMNAEMSQFMKQNYKKSKSDLYSGFIERCAELLADGGRLAMITQQSFMFISSFEELRLMLSNAASIETMAHTGPRAFPEVLGEKVNTTAFVLRRENFQAARQDSRAVYFRLVKEPDAEAKKAAFEAALAKLNGGELATSVYCYRQGDFAAIPGSPWVYWITRSLRDLFVKLPKLETIAQPRVGLQTGENFRFLRYWWEIGVPRLEFNCANIREAEKTGKRWFPYMKGGGFQRWYGNQKYTVNWWRNGAEIRVLGIEEGRVASRAQNTDFYFRRGVTWTDLTAGRFSARLSPGGFIFDVKGSSAFPEDIPMVLGLLNSSFANYALNLINPTVSYQVGDITRLPVPNDSAGPLRDLVNRAVTMAKADSEEHEASYDFIAPPAWPDGGSAVTARHHQRAHIDHEIDEEVFRLYEMSDSDRKAIEEELSEPKAAAEGDDNDADGNSESGEESDEAVSLTPEELAKRWFSYGVGVALGRFQPGVDAALGCGRSIPGTAAKLKQFKGGDGLMVLAHFLVDQSEMFLRELFCGIDLCCVLEQPLRHS
jgi:hypothetical protein